MRETITEKERLILVWEWPEAISRVLLPLLYSLKTVQITKYFVKYWQANSTSQKFPKYDAMKTGDQNKDPANPKVTNHFQRFVKNVPLFSFHCNHFLFLFCNDKRFSYETVQAGFTSLTLDWGLNGFCVRMVSGSPAVVTGVTLSTVPI